MSPVLLARRFPMRYAAWRDSLSLTGIRNRAEKLCRCCPGLQVMALVLSSALIGCTKQEMEPVTHEMLNATLWRQTSAEYPAIALQTYRLAQVNLDQALADPRWTAALEQTGDVAGLPPAIIADLDETILDNTSYEVRIMRRLGSYTPESFADWCREVNAPAIPGAREFLDYAAAHGVTIFYYSARKASLRECTTRNLRDLQLPFPDETRLLLANGESKSDYRAMVAGQYRILLLLGDNLEDFVTGSRTDPSVRGKLAERYAQRWGREWIVLPNPMYGHWEAALYGFDYQLPRPEQLRRKYLMLQEQ
jgi:5'-nucleotidase (lipoprotein e(P4) family)